MDFLLQLKINRFAHFLLRTFIMLREVLFQKVLILMYFLPSYRNDFSFLGQRYNAIILFVRLQISISLCFKGNRKAKIASGF
jgi:hypothetical protein